jgi:hypothetical protein
MTGLEQFSICVGVGVALAALMMAALHGSR